VKELSQCDFCDEFSGGHNNAFSRRYGSDPRGRTVFETQNFKVLPSLGQIVEGHVLVVPVRHYTALADMPSPLTEEVADLADHVRIALSANYGSCLLFEHGSRGVCSGGCGIYHAHLHAVPLREESEPVSLLKERFGYRKLGSIGDIASESNGTDSYLYYEDLHSNRYIFDVEYLPSQYMRRLMAEALGKDEWDWRKCGREEALLSTITRLSQAFGPAHAGPPTRRRPA
jgi:diadenosine tetraphosphate (Ap4A) HIT family hydrolase